ncbi:MAG TPA: chemotaxis protein CheA, partial [Pyrinomonadaceae bacterium]|nr:chemotaxis protein CheA [Pyrinomonadaceae bacterium]
FFEQFLDDYVAEADEHLRSVRRGLLDLEDRIVNRQPLDKDTLNELFRSFHTLKGISAMAGVSAAETLAHHMESYLRLLRDGETPVSENGILALTRSTQKLERIVIAKRDGLDEPDFEAEVAGLERLISEKGSAEESVPDYSSDLSSAVAKPRYLFRFLPAADLAARNINVNTVRQRLTRIGTLIKSTPKVVGAGQVAFEFLVETSADRQQFASWEADGVSYEAVTGAATRDTQESRVEPAPAAFVPSFVRVELSRLDALMLMVGELVISRAKLAEHISRAENFLPSEHFSKLEETNHTFEVQLRNLRDGVMRTRMNPIGEVFERLRFAIRDMGRESGKKINLETSGSNTEIDKLLVEKVLDPLLHLVRNAVSHGIEEAAERIASGKPEQGTIKLCAGTVGESIILEVEDDGAGIAREAVIARGRERGLIATDEEPDERALLDIMCSPGFSTRVTADKASGRGVGMDVVRRAVEEMGGSFSFDTTPGTGTKFRIQLPLTLAIADALIVAVDEDRFAVPQVSVREVIEVEQRSIRRIENNEIIDYRGAVLPIVRLSSLFRLKENYRDVFHAFVVGEGSQAVGIAVDRVVGQSEVVIRAMTDPLTQVSGISGATELGDGRLVLILEPASIARRLEQRV